MKFRLTTIIALMFMVGIGYSQDQYSAKVYIFRSSIRTGLSSGNFGNCTAFIDDRLVCAIHNNKYSTHEVKPGKHSFAVQMSGKNETQTSKEKEIVIDVEAGKTYYISMVYESTFSTVSLRCEEITENSARRLISSLKEDMDCYMKK